MNTKESPYLLKVLSGFNAGAKINLNVGSYTIGNSNDCEIIFHDKYIAPQHIKLIITTKDIFIHPLANPIYISGKDIGTYDTKLHPYQVVTIGNVHFTIGFKEHPWPAIKHPIFQNKNATNKHHRNNKQNKNSSWKYLLAGFVVLLSANTFYFAPKITQSLQGITEDTKIQQKIRTSMKDLGFSSLSIDHVNHKLLITGYVKNNIEKQKLIKEIESLNYPVIYRIWVDQELVNQAHYIAKAFGESDIQFSMSDNGKLIAKGYVKNSANWNKVQKTIINDIGGIKSIKDDNVDSIQQQLEKFQAYLADKPFKNRILLTIKEGKITVSGELTDDEISQWKKIRDNFFKQYGKIPDLVENLQSPRSRFKLAIRSVSVGKVPFITSKDDKKYLVGSHLGKGYYVKSITPDRILLRHNDIEIPVYFGKKDNDNATDTKQPAGKPH